MLPFLDKALWCGLAALALQFLYFGARLRHDRGPALLAPGLLLAAAAGLPGAWPGLAAHGGRIPWLRLADLAGLLVLPVLAAFLARTFRPPPRGLPALLGGSCAAAALLPPASAWGTAARGTCLLLFVSCAWSASSAARRSMARSERTRAGVLMAASAALALGLAAGLEQGGRAWMPRGAAAFAAASAWVLLSRYLEMHRQNRLSMERLASAYAALREEAPWRDLGASAAMISHEIRNYVSTLKANAALLAAGAGAAAPPSVAAIRGAADRLEVISRGIAVFASASGPPAGTSFRLADAAHACVERHFPGLLGTFQVTEAPGPRTIIGDPDRLEQVFLNLFRNAFEAGAGRIEVRVRAFGDRLIAAVEDDGRGCPPEDLPRIGSPFYSGREGRGGTGLGCSIAAAILRSHGASFRVYSKNAAGGGRRGLVAVAVFPLPGRPVAPPGGIVVLAEAEPVRDCVLPPLLNLGLRPLLLPGQVLLAGLGEHSRHRLLVVEEAWAERILPHWRHGPAYVADHRRIMWGAGGAAEPRLLSEESLAALLPEGSAP